MDKGVQSTDRLISVEFSGSPVTPVSSQSENTRVRMKETLYLLLSDWVVAPLVVIKSMATETALGRLQESLITFQFCFEFSCQRGRNKTLGN